MTDEARRLWQAFDRSTAYGCRMRGLPWDRDACQRAWDAYISRVGPVPTPMGLRSDHFLVRDNTEYPLSAGVVEYFPPRLLA